MALLFPWATKEYLLWEMSLPQLILYHNLGIELKYGTGNGGKPSYRDMSPKELVEAREKARAMLRDLEAQKRNEENKAEYREKYGDV